MKQLKNWSTRSNFSPDYVCDQFGCIIENKIFVFINLTIFTNNNYDFQIIFFIFKYDKNKSYKNRQI